MGDRGHYRCTPYNDPTNLDEMLHSKVNNLRSLSIRIGDELREQNTFLDGMTNKFDHSNDFLHSTMRRLSKLGNRHGSSAGFWCYLFCFTCMFFAICWFLIWFK